MMMMYIDYPMVIYIHFPFKTIFHCQILHFMLILRPTCSIQYMTLFSVFYGHMVAAILFTFIDWNLSVTLEISVLSFRWPKCELRGPRLPVNETEKMEATIFGKRSLTLSQFIHPKEDSLGLKYTCFRYQSMEKNV